MSDELTKLDNIKAVLTTADRMLWDMNYTTAEPAVIAVEQAIAALDALILTPPVDPVVEAVRGAALAMPGEWEAFPGECEKFAIKLRTELAKCGLELRTVADGGGA